MRWEMCLLMLFLAWLVVLFIKRVANFELWNFLISLCCYFCECDSVSTLLYLHKLCRFICGCGCTVGVVGTHACLLLDEWLAMTAKHTAAQLWIFSLRAAVGFHESVCSSHASFLFFLPSTSPLLPGTSVTFIFFPESKLPFNYANDSFW